MATNLPNMNHTYEGAILEIDRRASLRSIAKNTLKKKWSQGNFLSRFWHRWTNLLDRAPGWLFAPKPEPLTMPTTAEGFQNLAGQMQDSGMEDGYKRSVEHAVELSNERKAFHSEISKTIRRVFYALVATSLFCVVTLAGTNDKEFITPVLMIKLPVINFPMPFEAFLLVGPVVLITLAAYLHIFVGQHRRFEIALESSHPMLPNFSDWTPQLAVYFIFYWMVPVTLAVFAWTAWPRPFGPYLGYITIVLAAAFSYVQFRRCPQEWRAIALPLLFVVWSGFSLGFFWATDYRNLNLYKENLSGANLEKRELSGANLSEAILSSAILSDSNLSSADLSEANLSEADLSGADLSSADLSKANLSLADLPGAVLDEAILNKATLIETDLRSAELGRADLKAAKLAGAVLTDANLTRANLFEASLSAASLIRVNFTGARLVRAHLSGAILNKADLSEADLSEADLSEANLSEANLSGVDLTEAFGVTQSQLDTACGDESTVLPIDLIIPLCIKSE
ncbi:MAG: pentapeptide repeat-containing protein [Geminicoccaceae bacterium]